MKVRVTAQAKKNVKVNGMLDLGQHVRNHVGEELCPGKCCASLITELLMPTTVTLV